MVQREDDVAGVEFETMVLGRHMLTRVRRERHQLDSSAYIVLTRLRLQGPMSIGQLSDAFGLDASTLNRQTAALVRDGLVERIPDPEGGLARKFRLTAAGAGALEAERTANRRGLQRVLSDWSDEDVDQLAGLLRRYNAAIEARDHRPWPRS